MMPYGKFAALIFLIGIAEFSIAGHSCNNKWETNIEGLNTHDFGNTCKEGQDKCFAVKCRLETDPEQFIIAKGCITGTDCQNAVESWIQTDTQGGVKPGAERPKNLVCGKCDINEDTNQLANDPEEPKHTLECATGWENNLDINETPVDEQCEYNLYKGTASCFAQRCRYKNNLYKYIFVRGCLRDFSKTDAECRKHVDQWIAGRVQEEMVCGCCETGNDNESHGKENLLPPGSEPIEPPPGADPDRKRNLYYAPCGPRV